MVALFENSHFEFGSSALIHFTLEGLAAHRLDRHELLAQLMHRQRHFTEGTLSEYPPNTVKLVRRGRRRFVVLEVELKNASYLFQVFSKGCLLPHLFI
mmetsp:Transcript_25363/g.33914  ORF Transcript_25363/g.33914 Transcript_25363/m.33914 type:complete len:98 (-) Transcript_25363:1263-1556(-)